jgi:hypothetical protein
MDDRHDTIDRLWDALNRQDIDAAAALLHHDVDWQDLMNGGRRTGVADVRLYWVGVFGIMRPESTSLTFTPTEDGRVAVQVLHSIRDPQGKFWAEETVTHLFGFKDGLLSSMDVA